MAEHANKNLKNFVNQASKKIFPLPELIANLKILGLPVSAPDLNLPRNQVIQAIKKTASSRDRLGYLDFYPTTAENSATIV